MKAQFVFDLLKTNKNRFTPAQLETATGSARRARRALFLARKTGLALEAVRDGGKAIAAYVFSGASGAIALSAPVAKAKAAKASPKKAAAAKTKVVAKTKTVKAPVKKVVVDHSASNKLIDAMLNREAEAAIKAKNLETMKAVTKREKTLLDKIKEDTREEFSAMEAEWEAEEADRRDARTAVRENLPKEAYVE